MTPTQTPKAAKSEATIAKAAPKAETKPVAPTKESHKGFLVIVRIRGAPKMSYNIERTLSQMHLNTRHSCVVLADSPHVRGMIRTVNSFVAWGEADDATVKQLESKRAGDVKHAFRLASPKKGMFRKGIKLGSKAGGMLGYHGKDINELILRMV